MMKSRKFNGSGLFIVCLVAFTAADCQETTLFDHQYPHKPESIEMNQEFSFNPDDFKNEGAFVTIWKTDNPGDSNPDQVTIPVYPGETYLYDIYWEDVSGETINDTVTDQTGETTITFPAPGTYRLEISGTFPRIYFNGIDEAQKILSVQQWGAIGWTSMARAFTGASNLIVEAVDAPDLSGVTSLSLMFRDGSSLNSDFDHWDVSTIVQMDGVFFGASIFNGNIDNWDVSNVTEMGGMFWGANSFNRDISGWDVSKVENFGAMFLAANSFNQDIGGWDVSSATNLRGMFWNAISFNQDIGGWDVSNAIDTALMFDNANQFNQDISGWDVSNVTNMFAMFRFASSYNQDISGWDVASVTDMNNMFRSAFTFNQNLGGWDISNVTDMSRMLEGSGLSVENYDATLIGWENQMVQSDVELGALGLEYCDGAAARQSLIDIDGWVITGDSIAEGCGTVDTSLNIVEVSFPDINCVFNHNCNIIVDDFTDAIQPPGYSPGGFLQSRNFPQGEPETSGEGLYAYLYRVDLTAVSGRPICVKTLSVDFGPVEKLDYNGDGALNDVFVGTEGGLGSVVPESAEQEGSLITFTFEGQGVCPGRGRTEGETSYFFGLASVNAFESSTATIGLSNGRELRVTARTPQ